MFCDVLVGGFSELKYLQQRIKREFQNQKAITDYLREIRELIEATIAQRCEIAVIRNCVFNARLIEEKCSKNLQFTTEPEAVAINCLKYMGKDDIGLNFMVVNCDGVTVDLTTRKLLENNKMSEVYERSGDLCGSTFIDQEFIKFLHRKLGRNAIGLLRENYYDQFQYMIQDFCRNVKLLFTGDPSEYRLYELEIEETVPVLLQYIKGKDKEDIKENEWVVDIEYKDIKAMFDPIVDRIIKLIHSQLSNARKECSVMFLVGSFR
uniref:Hsp70 family protein n=3 Tax=Rhizophagus irregularis TaxID=588596 RepID=U9UDJ8_RHIID